MLVGSAKTGFTVRQLHCNVYGWTNYLHCEWMDSWTEFTCRLVLSKTLL
ncbi:unnamed protein product [Lathyrus oleraceus]